LFEALVRAGLEDLQVYLEYGTPGGGRRLDALLVGAAPGGVLRLVVVELKQWQACRVLDSDRVMRSDGLVTAHPVHQVAAYRSFFQHWRPGGAAELDVRGVVVLHNATAGEGAELAAGAGEDAGIRVLTAEDLSGPAHVLAERLQGRDLVAPDAGQVAAFEDIRWQPSSRLLDHVGADLVGHRSFALVGDQQDAFVGIRAAASHYLTAFDAVTAQRPNRQSSNGSGAIVTVSGGPGSGKTALAVRLLGYLMRQHPNAAPRFITPSGTLRAHLLDATSGHMAARELFPRPAGRCWLDLGDPQRATAAIAAGLDELQPHRARTKSVFLTYRAESSLRRQDVSAAAIDARTALDTALETDATRCVDLVRAFLRQTGDRTEQPLVELRKYARHRLTA
jgi:hypothetical protein